MAPTITEITLGLAIILFSLINDRVGADVAGVRSKRVLGNTEEDGGVDLLAEFKNRNLLRDDFDKPMQVLQEGGGGSNAKQQRLARTMTLDGHTFSVDSNELDAMSSIFTTNANYVMNGIRQTSVPTNVLYAPKTDPSVMMVVSAGQLRRAVRNDPQTGAVSSLLPVSTGPDLQVFATVDASDIDSEKLARFRFGDSHEHSGGTRRLEAQTPPRALQDSDCASYRIIEVAIAYDSRFCNALGGEERANEVVQVTVAQASLKFEKLCAKLRLSHLEGYCNGSVDPYASMFANSVCRRDDPQSTLKLFRDYWKVNRVHVHRDVAHLFHGFNHASGTVGCAWAGGFCSNSWFGYGINELIFGGNDNPAFWSLLFAHEMGHSAGAGHECCGSLMDYNMCAECLEFSDTSILHMNNHINSKLDECISTEAAGDANDEGPPPPPPVIDQEEDQGFTDNPGWANQDGTCGQHMELCNLGRICCDGINCYNGYICLDL